MEKQIKVRLLTARLTFFPCFRAKHSMLTDIVHGKNCKQYFIEKRSIRYKQLLFISYKNLGLFSVPMESCLDKRRRFISAQGRSNAKRNVNTGQRPEEDFLIRGSQKYKDLGPGAFGSLKHLIVIS